MALALAAKFAERFGDINQTWTIVTAALAVLLSAVFLVSPSYQSLSRASLGPLSGPTLG